MGKELTFRDLKGLPKFHKKHSCRDSYTTNNQKGTVAIVDEKFVKLPKLKPLVRFINHRQLPQNSIIKSATISKTCDNYYISFTVEYEVEEVKPVEIKKVVGLDYSQSNFYVNSEGEKANYPHYYRKLENKLKLEQQRLSRKVLKSNNWIKQKKKISKLQNKIANQRLDFIHKLSYRLAEEYDCVVVEDLDLKNLAQCLSLGKNLHDNGFGKFREFLAYKLEDRGKQLIKIDKFFPSSKTCSKCGHYKDNLQLSDRIYHCDNCGYNIDRDINASINIKEEGINILKTCGSRGLA